VNTSNTEV